MFKKEMQITKWKKIYIHNAKNYTDKDT
jgi:hypothetical protein